MIYSAQHHQVSRFWPAQINYRGRTFSATLGQLTSEGALLETHGITLPVGMEVELSLILGRKHWPIKSIITHITPHEIGMLFQHTQHELYAAARNDRPPSIPTVRPAMCEQGNICR